MTYNSTSRLLPGDLFLVLGGKGVVPGQVNTIGVVGAYGVFSFVLLPLDGQGIGHLPLFVQGIDIDGKGIFHATVG